MPDAVPPSPGRLRKRAEFLAAASGRRFHTERMTVQGRRREDIDMAPAGLRIGFTITKRVGHATERNRIRRRLRVAARLAGTPHTGENADVVVIGRREILTAEFCTLVEDLDRALRTVVKPRTRRQEGPREPSSGRHGSVDG